MAQIGSTDGNLMKNIAIIGSGISGLVSAYLLSREHNVTVFEKNDYIGGHTATKDVHVDGQNYAIDTGFIVCNDRTYPNFFKLLEQIGIELQPTEMSFSVANADSGLEYNGHNLNTLFAQRSNLFKPKFWHLIRQIIRFNDSAKQRYHDNVWTDELTLGQYLQQENFSDYFAQHYLYPMGAAIWSTSIKEMELFPLKFFVQFFQHHGLLNINDRPQWYVIPGGSRNYIAPLTKDFADNIELNSDISHINRDDNGVEIFFTNQISRRFDEVVLACHSDQALALLAEPTVQEQQILGNIPYAKNSVVMHTDSSVLPKAKLAWASWNYNLTSHRERPASVSYNMNILQSIKSDTTFCITLNQDEAIDADKILGRYTYHHPVFNNDSFTAQKRRAEICGHNKTHFAGAYWYNGFHEDGVRSAVDVGKRFGINL